MLDGHLSLQAFADSLCREYDADPDVVRQDITGFCEELARQGILEPIS